MARIGRPSAGPRLFTMTRHPTHHPRSNTMEHRLDFYKASPDAIKAMLAL